MYNAKIKYGGDQIPGSPFDVNTRPTGDASKCQITGLSTDIGRKYRHMYEFQVLACYCTLECLLYTYCVLIMYSLCTYYVLIV